MTYCCRYEGPQGDVFHDNHFVELIGADGKNRYRQTLACGGLRATRRELQWELDEWAVLHFQMGKRKNESKQSDWPETGNHEVEVKEYESCPGTRLAAAARQLQTHYPFG